MLKIDQSLLQTSTDVFTKAYRKASKTAFTEEIYLNKIIPKMSEKVNRHYPYQVKIARPDHELLRGDFTPSRVITIEKPFEGPFGEMWFGDATEGVVLLCGYENGDSRHPCKEALGDKNIHAILVGATGQGKSVTQNALIYGANYIYPPWEVNMVLCDAKIVEFKSIALNNPMPQVTAVAATGDADYLLSILETQRDAMMLRNSIFPKVASSYVEIWNKGKKSYKQIKDLTLEERKIFENPAVAPLDADGEPLITIQQANCKKIADFKEITGLTMPQIIIDIDEFQAMFSGAKKKASRITKALDDFARLGRNTGYHLLLASQELGSDIPKATLSNIKIRMAMGCQRDVSTAILGNGKGVDNYGKQGHMYINTSGGEDTTGEGNILFRVPYADPIAAKMAKAGIDLAKKLDVTPVLSFYDEQTAVYQNELKDYLKQFSVSSNRILLGEPSFVMKDREQIVKMELNGYDIENILIDSPIDSGLSRHILNILGNFELCPNVINIVNCNAHMVAKITKIKDFASSYFEDKQYSSSNTNGFHAVARETIYRRKMLLQSDKQIRAGDNMITEITEKFFDDNLGKGSEFDTALNRKRFAMCIYLQTYDVTYQQGFLFEDRPTGEAIDLNEDMIENAALVIKLADSIGCSEKFSQFSDLPPVYFWDIGLQNELDFGRSSKSRELEKFVRVLQESTEAACRFILVTKTMSEIESLRDGIRWVILDSVAPSELGKLKCQDDYPDTVSKNLAVLFDKSDKEDPAKKFKKLMLTGEII